MLLFSCQCWICEKPLFRFCFVDFIIICRQEDANVCIHVYHQAEAEASRAVFFFILMHEECLVHLSLHTISPAYSTFVHNCQSVFIDFSYSYFFCKKKGYYYLIYYKKYDNYVFYILKEDQQHEQLKRDLVTILKAAIKAPSIDNGTVLIDRAELEELT